MSMNEMATENFLTSNWSEPDPMRFPSADDILTSFDMAYLVLSNLVSFFSMAGSMVIISIYLSMKEIRTKSRLLLVFLSVADIFVAVSTLMQTSTYYKNAYFPHEKYTLCQFSAFWLIQSEITVVLWTISVSFYLFMCVSCQAVTLANRLHFMFHIFSWTMPFVVALTADLTGVFGYDITSLITFKHSTSCWISSQISNRLPWYLLTMEGWVLAAFVIICLLYIPVSWSILCKKGKGKHVMGDDVIEELAIQTANQQLRFIPVIYVCTRLWGTIYFFMTRYPQTRHLRAYDWLLIIKAVGDNSQGLFNALFFCLATKQVRRLMTRKLSRCCSCFGTWFGEQRWIGKQRWLRVSSIVKPPSLAKRRSRNLDGSDLDISGISLDLPGPDADLGMGEEAEEIIFEA